MKSSICISPFILCSLFALTDFAADPALFVSFKDQQIDKTLKIGYAVKIADLNGDGKPDIVVVDKHRVIWFENPGKQDAPWKLHTILEGTTKPDNVCLDIMDIDGDGKPDIALGAGWMSPMGTIQWLKQPANIDEPWKVYPIGEEPWVHRMRFVKFPQTNEVRLVVAPLQGAGSTAKANWSEKGVRLLAYPIPKDPVAGPWVPEVIDDSLHVCHNFVTVERDGHGPPLTLVFASYEGLTLFVPEAGQQWINAGGEFRIAGNQDNPKGSRGCSEVKFGRLKDGGGFFATIEPWHGNQVVVYTEKPGAWSRHVIDVELKWGHGLWCADLDGDGNDEIIVGVRDPFNERIRSGVNVFRATDATATKWEKHVIDNGGVAVEDLACADLNGDGKIDIVAVGRATGNVKIYWNQGAKK